MKRQSDLLRELAREQHHTIVCSTFDYGNGMDFEREGLRKIKEVVEADSIDAILVKDISRIGRNFIKTHEYLGYLRKHKVRVLQADILNFCNIFFIFSIIITLR